MQFACGTPFSFCTGRSCLDQENGQYGKRHSDIAGTKACQANYLIKQGYEKVGSNAFASPNGGPILVMSKRPQRLKPGKIKNGYMAQPLKIRDCMPLPK